MPAGCDNVCYQKHDHLPVLGQTHCLSQAACPQDFSAGVLALPLHFSVHDLVVEALCVSPHQAA